jgi:uncharacterized membrane protein
MMPTAEALDRNDIQALQIAVHDLCVQPDKKGHILRVEGNLDSGASLRVAGVRAGASVTREDWDGISQQLRYKTDPRACAIKLTGILAPLLSGEKTRQRASIYICNERGVQQNVAVAGFGIAEKQWMKSGWYPIDQGSCLVFSNFATGMFYYYWVGSGFEATGNVPLCVAPQDSFNEIVTGDTCEPPYVVKKFKARYVASNGIKNQLRPLTRDGCLSEEL